MPKINVYLSDDLADAVRRAGIPVSTVCQRALADAVAAVDGPAAAATGAGAAPSLDRLTNRAQQAVAAAHALARGQHREAGSVDLVAGLVEEGHNLALTVLAALDIEPADLLDEARGRGGAGRPLAAVLGDAVAQALDLAHNYVGCEHLLLGLVDGPAEDPAAAALATLGLNRDAVRAAVVAALAGVTYAQATLSLTGLSAPVRSMLDEIRQRLQRLEKSGRP